MLLNNFVETMIPFLDSSKHLFEIEIFYNIRNKAVQLIEFDYHAHLDSKAGFLISGKSPLSVFRWSGG